jgi:lipoyl(octanoyl) transferase
MHGFSLNCSNDFAAYDSIVACGLADAGVTSISTILGRRVDPMDVVPIVQRHFSTVAAVTA